VTGHVYFAPIGADPNDLSQWTYLGYTEGTLFATEHGWHHTVHRDPRLRRMHLDYSRRLRARRRRKR
jgi:hypothetical protein